MRTVVNVGVPVLVFVAMFVVGTELTTDDFRRIARRPVAILFALVGQVIALPLIAWMVACLLRLQPDILQGLLLVAACPSGAMANVYTYLARSNVALSVTLTAVSCLTALLTTPVTLAILQTETEETTRLSVPVGPLAGQLIVLLILPVLAGMYVRHCQPQITQRYSRMLFGANVVSLAFLLTAIIVQESHRFASALPEIGMSASLLTVLAFVAGWATGLISGANATDCFAVGMVFVVRNVGVATAVAVTVLGRSEFAVFATAYFLTQVPLLLAAAFAFRRLAAVQVDTGVEVQ